jgi:hypothetical protein
MSYLDKLGTWSERKKLWEQPTWTLHLFLQHIHLIYKGCTHMFSSKVRMCHMFRSTVRMCKRASTHLPHIFFIFTCSVSSRIFDRTSAPSPVVYCFFLFYLLRKTDNCRICNLLKEFFLVFFCFSPAEKDRQFLCRTSELPKNKNLNSPSPYLLRKIENVRAVLLSLLHVLVRLLL